MMIQIDPVNIKQAEEISLGLSDLLCWLSGYVSGRPDDPELPMGREAVREINIALKDAITRAEATTTAVRAVTGPNYEATEDLGEIFAVVVEGGRQAPIVMEAEAGETGRRAAFDRLKSMTNRGGWLRGCVVRLTYEGGNEAVLHEMKRLQRGPAE